MCACAPLFPRGRPRGDYKCSFGTFEAFQQGKEHNTSIQWILKIMAFIEPLDANALRTTQGLYSDCGFGQSSSSTADLHHPHRSCREDSSSSSYGSTAPLVYGRSISAGAVSQYGGTPFSSPARSSASLRSTSLSRKRMIMDDGDKGIYNSLGSSSSPSGKVIAAAS